LTISCSNRTKKNSAGNTGREVLSNTLSSQNTGGSTDNQANGSPNSESPNSTDTRLVLTTGRVYTLKIEINIDTNKTIFTIEDKASGEERSLELELVTGNWDTSLDSSLKAHSKELDARIDGDNPSSRIYASCYMARNVVYPILWHLEDIESITANNFDRNKNLVLSTNASSSGTLDVKLVHKKAIRIGNATVERDFFLVPPNFNE
jgi:hypothetical protein